MNKTTFRLWWLAARPKTLTITLSPIMCAAVLAYDLNDSVNILTLVSIFFSGLLIQIGTNLYNDAADFERGADGEARLGPERVTAQGWLSASAVKQGALISFLLAFVCGIYLAFIGGLPIIVLGLAAIISGYAYTGGPKPIAYSPFGELFVIVFFGIAALAGSYYLLTLNYTVNLLFVGLALGSFAAAILLVNNYRDLDNDTKANKITLVYYLGRKNSRTLFTALVVIPYLLLTVSYLFTDHGWAYILFPMLSLPLAFNLIKEFYTTPVSKALNLILIKTAKLQLFYAVLFSFGVLL